MGGWKNGVFSPDVDGNPGMSYQSGSGAPGSLLDENVIYKDEDTGDLYMKDTSLSNYNAKYSKSIYKRRLVFIEEFFAGGGVGGTVTEIFNDFGPFTVTSTGMDMIYEISFTNPHGLVNQGMTSSVSGAGYNTAIGSVRILGSNALEIQAKTVTANEGPDGMCLIEIYELDSRYL
jgi:hypothetical protein